VYRLARTNTLVNQGVAVADKDRKIRPIPYLFVGPTVRGEFGERAADVADCIDLPVGIDLSPGALIDRLRAIFPPPLPDVPSVLVRLGMSRLLGAQGPQQKELLSYVLFEPRFAKAAADLGRVDAYRELRVVAELSEPNPVEGWRIGPMSSPPRTTTLDELTDMTLTHERFRRIIANNFGRAGIANPEDLRTRGASEKERRRIARRTGMAEPNVLGWVQRSDLMRVSGIGPEYAHLLVLSGVNTLEELSDRSPESLLEAITATNDQRNAVERMPAESDVSVWINQAEKLEVAIA
jgi:predicted flap endonuclease-1-like 5' DNA nuclease